MLSFLRQSPPLVRTKLSHLPLLKVDGDRASIAFSNVNSKGVPRPTITFLLPPAASGVDPPDNSSLIPPLHFHFNQAETFTCIQGSLKVLLNDCSYIVRATDRKNMITVSPGQYHRFMNASSEEDLVLEMWKEPDKWEQEERFFRNLAGYLKDEVKPGKSMVGGVGVFQVLLLAWESETVLCETVHILGLPKWIGRPVATVFNWIGAVVIGKWLLGYSGNYKEYYHESWL